MENSKNTGMGAVSTEEWVRQMVDNVEETRKTKDPLKIAVLDEKFLVIWDSLFGGR